MLRFMGNGDQKKFTKNPRPFSMQNSQASSKEIFTNFFLESRQSNRLWLDSLCPPSSNLREHALMQKGTIFPTTRGAEGRGRVGRKHPSRDMIFSGSPEFSRNFSNFPEIPNSTESPKFPGNQGRRGIHTISHCCDPTQRSPDDMFVKLLAGSIHHVM